MTSVFAASTAVRSAAQGDGVDLLPERIFPQLDPILDKALEQSPQMLLKNIELAQAEANVYVARSSLWPQVGIGGNYSINESTVADSPSPTSRSDGIFYSVSLQQPVFHWGTLRARAESSRIGVLIAEKNYAEAYRNLVQSIRTQFLNLILRKLSLRNARFAAERSAKALAVEEEKLQLGRAAPSDLAQFRLARDETQLTEDRAAEDFAQTKRFLMRLAGLEDLPDESIPDNLPELSFAESGGAPLVSRFVHGGVEQTYLAATFRYSIEQADLNYRITKYTLFPKLALSLGVGQSNTTNVVGSVVSQSGVFSQSASLSLSWPIFDGFATRGAKRQALLSKSFFERQLSNYIATTSDQARSLEKQVEFAARAMRIATARRDVAQGALKLAQDNLAAGNGSEFAVASATLAYNSHQVQAANMRIELLSRWSELLSLLHLDPALARIPANYRPHAKK